jgi:hypothetical protein
MLFQKHLYSIITFVLVSALSNQSSLRCRSRILPTTFAGEYANILPSLLMGVGPKNKHMAFPSGQYATTSIVGLGFTALKPFYLINKLQQI